MSETLASLRSPGRSREAEPAAARPVLRTCALAVRRRRAAACVIPRKGASSGGRGYGSSAGALVGAAPETGAGIPFAERRPAPQGPPKRRRAPSPGPAARTPKARIEARMQPRRELDESKRKKKKGKKSEMAFFCFLLLFGIGTFQRVMSEKSKKNFRRPSTRLTGCARSASSPWIHPVSRPFARGPVRPRAALLIRNMISTPSQFWKGMFGSFATPICAV